MRSNSTTLKLASPARGRWWLAAVGLLGAALWGQDALAVREISAKRECAVCHVMWISDFKREDVKPLIRYEPKPVTDTGRQDVSSTERMCFSCHDGFMLDSRAAWRSKAHQHPVGVKPTEKVKIPTSEGKTVFPLNDDGKVYCGTCHTAHGVDWDQKQSPVFLRVNNVDSSMCIACHIDQSTGPKEGNHPIFKRPKEPPKALLAVGARLGREQDVVCQSCHSPHTATAKSMLLLGNDEARLCRSCHTDKDGVRNTKHDLTVMAPDSKNVLGQTPSQSGPCGTCHVPHGAKGPTLWAREPHPVEDATAGACLGCHNEKGMAKEKLAGLHTHPTKVAIGEIGISVRDGKWTSPAASVFKRSLVPLPLYLAHGERSAESGLVGCGSCHDPHNWSPLPKAVKPADPKKTEGDGASSFLRIANDKDAALCTNCHADKLAIARSPHAPRPTEKAEPPGVCGSCHMPHNAKGTPLWARTTGPGKGPMEKLCTDCHREDGMAAKKLARPHGHPTGVAFKGRPEKLALPLFARNGRHAADGEVDCASCHDPHQWDPSNLASRAGEKKDVNGDPRTSFLRRPAAGDSALCGECHRAQALVRRTDHDLRVTAQKAVNAMGQAVAVSGVCGQCHVPHGAKQAKYLWARTPGKGQDTIEQDCRSCHAKDQLAKAKPVPRAQHPQKAVVSAQTIRARLQTGKSATTLPVFDAAGAEENTGLITCTTCHNPHQWNPAHAVEGPGKNTEGDVRSSFLRLVNTEGFVCADCHGLDSLFRYKYYHGQSSRKPYPLAR